MKKPLLLIIVLLFALNCFSQDEFEGTVIFQVTISGKNASMLKGMFPDSYNFKYKGSNVRLELVGGMLGNLYWPIITRSDSGCAYMVNDNEKTAYKFDSRKYASKFNKNSSFVEMDDEKIIENYNCNHYSGQSDSRNGQTTVSIWTTEELNLTIPANNPLTKNFNYFGVSGFPLLVEINVNHQSTEFKLTLKATTIKKEKLDNKLFEIPQEYSVKPYVLPASDGF
jgi:hypothetical protein